MRGQGRYGMVNYANACATSQGQPMPSLYVHGNLHSMTNSRAPECALKSTHRDIQHSEYWLGRNNCPRQCDGRSIVSESEASSTRYGNGYPQFTNTFRRPMNSKGEGQSCVRVPIHSSPFEPIIIPSHTPAAIGD